MQSANIHKDFNKKGKTLTTDRMMEQSGLAIPNPGKPMAN